MSTSSDRTTRPGGVLRDVAMAPMPPLADLDALTGAGRFAVDPAAFDAAVQQGYEDGWARGHRDGFTAGQAQAREEAARLESERAAAVELALEALARAGDELGVRRLEHSARAEDALVNGALELATALLGRELELATAPGRDALARALRLADGNEAALVRMHPDDIATLGDHTELAPGRDLTVLADAAVDRGGCLVEVGDGRIDARIGAALERVEEVLRR